MENFLTVNTNVISNVTSGDDIPGGVACPTIWELIDIPSFLIGIFVGILLVLIIRGIISYTKFIIKDNKDMADKLKHAEDKKNQSKSD